MASSTSDIGSSNAAPRPLTTRPTIRMGAVGASAQINVPMENKAMPSTKTRRRP